jgi:hypothetical protein
MADDRDKDSGLGFGEVELSDGRRLVVLEHPGLLGPLITISVQRLYGRKYDTESEIVLPAREAQAMADIVSAFLAARQPPGEPCRHPGCFKPAVTSLGNCTEHWGEGSDDSSARPAPAKEQK